MKTAVNETVIDRIVNPTSPAPSARKYVRKSDSPVTVRRHYQMLNQLFNMAIREQNGAGWKALDPELRLANRKQINWTGDLPPANPQAPALAGYILRIPDEH